MRSLALLLGITLLLGGAAARGDAASKPFKPFKLKTVDGARKTLSDFPGRATLVVFFFPTCTYCNAAFPAVQKIYDTYKDRGLAMVWINAVPEEDRLVKAWQARSGYTVPVLVGASQAALQRDYDLTTTPTHYLIGPDRAVLFTQVGFESGDDVELERAIVRALEGTR